MGEPEYLGVTTDDLKPLRKKYKKAVENKEETFTYKGKVVLTNYAKYLIEYLESDGKHRE